MPQSRIEHGTYQVIDRLLALRDLLRTEPHTREQISVRLPTYYSDDESSARKLRRDLLYLERWGYQVIRNRSAKTYALSMSAIESDWTDEELEALAALRDCFKAGLPYADTIQAILERIEQGLSGWACKQFMRRPPLIIQLTTVQTGGQSTSRSSINAQNLDPEIETNGMADRHATKSGLKTQNLDSEIETINLGDHRWNVESGSPPLS